MHEVHEINVQSWSVETYTQRYLPSATDPLVVLAPFNPFDTTVQIWLARNDRNYQPLYLETQENLGHLDLRPSPLADDIDLDIELDTVQESNPPGIYLTQSDTTVFTPIEDPAALALQAAFQAEADTLEAARLAEAEALESTRQAEIVDAVAHIPGLENEPVAHVSTFQPLAVDGQLVSPSSSILPDYSDIVEGLTPSSSFSISSVITISSEQVAANPDFQDLLEALENSDHIPINLNINPHHNDVDTSEASMDIQVISDDDDLDDPRDVTPPGQYHVGLWDLYGPLRDIGNFFE
jgi:hypothetical protein